ncbi:uncharacterized protein LOC114931133 [Nylanderia fulva]|uniref:uncharacterized protein LOC114931133 n=1 Tax=Nylanderia fulva TaxID=613905 RepID=UPI0010FB7FB6|nr:uncharacterized protein LOC114931133 [Nylanderia fulva]
MGMFATSATQKLCFYISPRITNYDLTERYCIEKILRYVRQRSVKEKWKKFKQQSKHTIIIEQTATFVAKWLQPEKEVSCSYIKSSLNTIAQDVLSRLKQKHPNHKIFSENATHKFSYTSYIDNNVYDNFWNLEESTQILDILEEHMFKELNFRPSKSNVKKLEYSCIDNVLKNKYGHKIILLIIYQSVARRLGVRCDIENIRNAREQLRKCNVHY